MTHTNELVDRAIVAIRRGEKTWGRDLLVRALRDDPGNERAWLWMSAVVVTAAEQRYCLALVIELNEENWDARAGLAALGRGAARRPIDLSEAAPVMAPPPHPLRAGELPPSAAAIFDVDEAPGSITGSHSLILAALLLVAMIVAVAVIMLGIGQAPQ